MACLVSASKLFHRSRFSVVAPPAANSPPGRSILIFLTTSIRLKLVNSGAEKNVQSMTPWLNASYDSPIGKDTGDAPKFLTHLAQGAPEIRIRLPSISEVVVTGSLQNIP